MSGSGLIWLRVKVRVRVTRESRVRVTRESRVKVEVGITPRAELSSGSRSGSGAGSGKLMLRVQGGATLRPSCSSQMLR